MRPVALAPALLLSLVTRRGSASGQSDILLDLSGKLVQFAKEPASSSDHTGSRRSRN